MNKKQTTLEMVISSSDRVFTYKVCNRCKKTSKFVSIHSERFSEHNCKYCKLVPDESLDDFKLSKYTRPCIQCKRKIEYSSRLAFLFADSNPTPCLGCRRRKAFLDGLISMGKNCDAYSFDEETMTYTKPCPKCNKPLTYKTHSRFTSSVTLDSWCKSCSSIEQAKKQRIEVENEWGNIIGRWPVRTNTLSKIKTHWNGLSEEARQELLQKTPVQRKWYWSHLSRKNNIVRIRKLHKIFTEKYGGENHWMKRPEVLRKIKNSCKKYCGDGHWFRKNKKKQ